MTENSQSKMKWRTKIKLFLEGYIVINSVRLSLFATQSDFFLSAYKVKFGTNEYQRLKTLMRLGFETVVSTSKSV